MKAPTQPSLDTRCQHSKKENGLVKGVGNSSLDLQVVGSSFYLQEFKAPPLPLVSLLRHTSKCASTHTYIYMHPCASFGRVRMRSTHLRCQEHAMLPQPLSTQRHTTHASRTIAFRGTQVRPSSSHPLAIYVFTYLLFMRHLLVLEARIYLFLNMYIYVESTSSCS